MERVVVTGATSMIGVALIEECVKKEVQVLALVRRASAKVGRLPLSKYVTVVECDLDELKNLKTDVEYDVFYHLGWTHTDREGRADAKKQSENIAYTLDALELAERLGCKKFIGAGSQAEYGIHKESKTRPETELAPLSAYGIAKAAAGKLCSVAAAQKKMDFSWVRIFSVYGKYELPGTLIQTVLPKMVRNERCSLTEGIQDWDYLYSADAGEAFYLVGEKAGGNNFYCLGSGRSYPLRQYVCEMKDVLESDSELGFGDVPYAEGKICGMCADITAIQRDTGWYPKTTFADGIRKELDRWKRS